MAPLSSTHWPRVLTLWLCGVAAAMQFSKVSFAFQTLQATYAATPAAMGWILSTVGIVGLVFGVTMGLCAPAIGYRRLLLVGMGLGAVLAGVLYRVLPGVFNNWGWDADLTLVFFGAALLHALMTAPDGIAGQIHGLLRARGGQRP